MTSAPPDDAILVEWWLCCRRTFDNNALHKGFDSLVVLASWLIWKERNHIVFHGVSKLPDTQFGR